MARRPHVALMIETAGAYGRQLLQGITRYLHMHRSWSIFLERRELEGPAHQRLRRPAQQLVDRRQHPALGEGEQRPQGGMAAVVAQAIQNGFKKFLYICQKSQKNNKRIFC